MFGGRVKGNFKIQLVGGARYCEAAFGWAKGPGGGVALPRELSPQHTASPFLRNPQVCVAPAFIALKLIPSGGTTFLLPQHTGAPSASSAQMPVRPADIAV